MTGGLSSPEGTSAKKAVSLTKEEEALKAKYQNYNFLEDKECKRFNYCSDCQGPEEGSAQAQGR
jgi:hypothetical protein